MSFFSWVADAWEFAKNLIRKVAQFVTALFIHLLSFAKHIVNWFKDPNRLANLRKNKDVIAVALKENLDSNNYNVVNCLYNKATEEVVDISDSALYEAEDLDSKTENAFGDKPMIVLN